MSDDAQLLRRFAEENAQDAFAELVQRRVNLVYSAALRQVGGDAHLAEDVTQGVFVALARSARALMTRPVLTSWLYTTTRFIAAKTVRERQRRQAREQATSAMDELMHSAQPDPQWEELRSVIDTAMHELEERDREAILLRYFEGRSLREVGEAIGLAENAARMRVDRALEKLRVRLTERRITSTVAALTAALTSQAVIAAPVGVAAAATGAAVSAGAIAVWPAVYFMSSTKIAGGVVIAAVLGTAAYFGGRVQGNAQLAERETEIARLQAENRTLVASARRQGTDRSPQTAPPDAVGETVPHPASRAATSPGSKSTVLRLADWRQRGLFTASMKLVTNDGKMTPAFTEVFELTSTEATAVQSALDQAREQLFELERANATVSRDANGNVVIGINPFPAEGGKIYDGLMKSFAETLGPDRHAAYLALGSSQVETALGDLGAAQRTVTFSYRDPAAGGQPERLAPQASRDPTAVGGVSSNFTPGAASPYLVKTESKRPGAGSVNSSAFSTLEEAANHAGTVGRLVPSDFAR